ncbi:MAG: carboxypeptidase-like regulatory domain-containing protein [Bacteroidales bacterium]|jgi:hypothetical protein|nr:carboxypeptidase-like regulatory domain-containing protein [Bacteroidales bacterium]
MKILIIFFLLLFPGGIFARRTLEATVSDGMTGKPVGNAHVYLDGTTIGTTTDSLGRFRLTVRNAINTTLVISHLMYEKMIVPEPFLKLPKVIYLEENVNVFDDVVITAKDISKRKRREMLAVFREQLLGYEQGAKSSRILNEDDVVLVHDKEKKELRAYAQKPIEVVNHYLKYRILWELIEFKIEYSDKSLSDKAIQHISAIGTVSFTDIGTRTEALRIRRRDVLRASTRHFFDLLAKEKMKVDVFKQLPLDLASFRLFEISGDIITLHDPEKYFIISEIPDDPSMKRAVINSEIKDSILGHFTANILDSETMKKLEMVSGTPHVSSDYQEKIRKAQQIGYRPSSLSKYRQLINYMEEKYQIASFPEKNYSRITFYADTFTIDAYGNTDLYKNFLIENRLARQRLGDLLPLDYEDLPLGMAVTNEFQAEEPDSLLTAEDRIRLNFLKQLQDFPQEKIYVHTDKSYYLSGETVWFRVHLADYVTHDSAGTGSRYVYGELFNPVDSLIQRIKIRRDSSDIFRGYFELPPDLAGGDYRLCFYTRYMEQSGEEYFFNRTISVGHTLSALYHTEAAFSYMEDSDKLRAVLKFIRIKDNNPFVPQLLRLVNASGKEAIVPVSMLGVAEFDILPEQDLVKNRLYIEYEYNNMRHKQYLAVPPSRNEYDVSFFPEGGAFPANARVRIAFKALQLNGMGEQVTGKVYDANGDTVAVFTSNPLGMGSFSLLPKEEGKYTALCRNSFGMEKRFDLPGVNENAVNLKAIWESDRLVVKTVHSSGYILPDSLRLLIHCRGILFYNELWDIGKGLSIRKELFPSGVLQLLLVDSRLNPVSERLVFNMNEQDIAEVAISTEKENYGKREQVRTGISVVSHDSIPLQGSFSVSVTADRNVLPDTTVSILGELLLASELKGYIESPAWYFTGGRIGEIDHLMLTQGWSRYDINAVLEGNIQTPEILPEAVSGISGRVTSGLFLQNSGKDYYVVMNVAGNRGNQYATIAKVEDGRFNMIYDEQPNGVSYMLQLVFPPNSIRAKMWLDSIIYPPVRIHLPYRFDTERSGFYTYLRNAGQQYVSDDGELVKYIDEVVITAKRLRGISPLSPGRLQDRIISLEELSKKKTSAPTLMQYLMSVPEVSIRRDSDGTMRVRYKNGLYYYDYVFVVDGRWWPMYATDEVITQGEAASMMGYVADVVTERSAKIGQPRKTVVSNSLDRILSIPINRVEEIEIVRAPAPPIRLKDFGNMVINDPLLYGIREKTKNTFEYTSTTIDDYQGYLGTILITTKARDGGGKDEGSGRSVKITPLGYQASRTFYSPVYETKEQQDQVASDLRSTIYWNPDVCTNKDGESEISFYAADAESTYTVTIEGITSEGVLIRKTEKINRK